ncbi:MAG: TorF family putative porin [Phycisphaerales bacterium]
MLTSPLFLAALTCLGVQPDAGAPPVEAATTNSDRVHVTVDLTVTSQYFFRGIIQETDGFIFQPSIELGFDLHEADTWSLGGYLGIWNSFHDEETGSADPDDFVSKWYEVDFYAGLSLTTGRLTTDLAYTSYTSPNDAFTSVEEFSLTFAVDDSGWFGDISFAPYVTFALETGDGQADGGADQGLFVAVGIEPSHTYESSPVGEITVSAPIEAGFSLDDYYEGAMGDESFGYLTAGLAASIPLPAPQGFGSLSLHAGVDFLLLGDSNEALNNSDDSEWIVHGGITMEF